MTYRGSCHCGRVAYEAEGELKEVIECNCSHCSRKGYLLWFVHAAQFHLLQGKDSLATYTFNKHLIQHHFCSNCGCAPFGEGKGREGEPMIAINVRCLEDVEPASLQIRQVDGRSY